MLATFPLILGSVKLKVLLGSMGKLLIASYRKTAKLAAHVVLVSLHLPTRGMLRMPSTI
jgi:hypothetical protein